MCSDVASIQSSNLQSNVSLCTHILHIGITTQNSDDKDVPNEWILTCVNLNYYGSALNVKQNYHKVLQQFKDVCNFDPWHQ